MQMIRARIERGDPGDRITFYRSPDIYEAAIM